MTISNILEKNISRSRFRNPWNLGRSYEDTRKPIIDELKINNYICNSTRQSMVPSVAIDNIDSSWTISFAQDEKTVSELFLTNGLLTELTIGSPNKNTVIGNINSSSWIGLQYVNTTNSRKETFNKEYGIIGLESHKISISSKVTIENCNLLKKVNEIYVGAINKGFPADISISTSGGQSVEIIPCQNDINCTEDGREIINIRFNLFYKKNYNYETEKDYIDPNSFIVIEILNPDGLIPDSELDLYTLGGLNEDAPSKMLSTNFETILFNPKLTGGKFIVTAVKIYGDDLYNSGDLYEFSNIEFENTSGKQIAEFIEDEIKDYLNNLYFDFGGLQIELNNNIYPAYDFDLHYGSNKIVMCDKVFYTDLELENYATWLELSE